MHLLVLTPQFPYPPHQGTTLRNFNLIKGLAGRHTLDLFSLLAPGDDPDSGPVKAMVRHLVTAPQPTRTMSRRFQDLLSTALPDMALRLWSEEAFARLRLHCEASPPQIMQVEGIEMFPYVLALAEAGYELPRIVYDAHNAETLLQQRAFLADIRRPKRWIGASYSAVQTAKLRRYERRLLSIVDGIAAVSEADAANLHQLAPAANIKVVTNGVDLATYDPTVDYPNPFRRSGANLVFTGKMDFRPNIDGVLWFAEQVLPRLQDTDLDPHFWIVGKNPHARLEMLRHRPDITLTGSVPDIRPYIAHADVYVVPLLAGGGTRLKILEAMAMARPIVSTRLGADGFPVVDGEQLALADTAAEFSDRCAELLHNPIEAKALGGRGRVFVEANYRWDAIVPHLEALYAQS